MALLAPGEEAEEARMKSVADALYQGLRGALKAPPRHVSTVIPSSRPKLKLKFAGEGPGQVVYISRPSRPKVLPGGLVAIPQQVGWCWAELHISLLGEFGAFLGGDGSAPGRRGRPGCFHAPYGQLLRLPGQAKQSGGRRRLWGIRGRLRGETCLLPTAPA